jgi:hypothetical protein
MITALKEYLQRKGIPYCKHCGSWDVDKPHSGYTRGWNNLCEQATGDRGAYCNNCGQINWDQSLEDYKKSLPDWCKAFETEFYKKK